MSYLCISVFDAICFDEYRVVRYHGVFFVCVLAFATPFNYIICTLGQKRIPGALWLFAGLGPHPQYVTGGAPQDSGCAPVFCQRLSFQAVT